MSHAFPPGGLASLVGQWCPAIVVAYARWESHVIFMSFRVFAQ